MKVRNRRRQDDDGASSVPQRAGLMGTSAAQHPLALCRPRGDRVVVRRDRLRDRTDGGLMLPDSVAGHKQQVGTVVSVGPGRRLDSGEVVPVDISPGDRVIITGYAGLEIGDPLNSSREDLYVILREEDVLAFLAD